MITRLNFIILLLFIVALLQAEILDSLTTAVIDSSLQVLNLRRNELGFKKALVKDDTFKLKLVEKILHDPLYFPDYMEKTEDLLSQFKPPRILINAAEQLDLELQIEQDNATFKPDSLEEYLLAAMNRAEEYRSNSIADLDSLELHDLIMKIPSLWAGEEENDILKGALHFEFNTEVDTSRTIDTNNMLNIIKKIDREALHKGGIDFIQSIWNVYMQLDQDDFQFYKPFVIDGVQGKVLLHQSTEFGEIVFGSSDNNIYIKDFAVIIDPGGDDLYKARNGGAVGELSNAYSAVIDLAGNDIYFNENKIINHGSGFLGYGVLIDHDGNDVYRSSNYSQGAGLFGLGILYDNGGEDDYRSGFFSQAAANVGSGILIDKGEGDDRYFAPIWAQGIAGVFGYAALCEAGGDDTYRVGGKIKHAPLLPNDYQSFSHGFGMGWRPRAGGGIGILFDKNGNDFYDGEVFCQGTSYWYSLGLLIDNSGNDHYSAAQYAQGAGVHLSIGGLWDEDGDDQYHSRNGVVGGTAHDLSVGMLIEENGDDYYIVSGGYGTSLTNSFALFVDKLGNDMYSTWEKFSFGAVREARGYPGCGFFFDLEGVDHYFSNTSADNAKLWSNQDWAIGIDLDREIITSEKEKPIGEIILTKEDSLRSVEELYEEASLWQVGSNRRKVARAKRAFLNKGVEAVKYVVKEKLETDSSLEMRLIRELAEAHPDSMSQFLIPKLESNIREVRRNSISLLGTTKNIEATQPLIDMLSNQIYKDDYARIISTLGKIEDSTAVNVISRFLSDDDETIRMSSINALAKIKNRKAIPMLIESLDDSVFTIRSVAASAFKEFPDKETTELLFSSYENAAYPEFVIRALANVTNVITDSTDYKSRKLKKRIIKFYKKTFKSENEQVIAASIEALSRIDNGKYRNWIEKKMKHLDDPYLEAIKEKINK